MNRNHLFILFILSTLFILSCSQAEIDKSPQLPGLWRQEKLTEDGLELSPQNMNILFESNGVYRTFAQDSPVKEHFGAWSITDNQWLETTADTWRLNADPANQKPEAQWAKNHIPVRFTILKISSTELEIRIKTFVGEQKYAALFVENARPLITSENEDAIQWEYKTLKTYIYTFKKVTN